MKPVKNQSPKATRKLLQAARAIGLRAEAIERSKPRHRRYDPLGSTFVPQKIIWINGIRMSIGQAKQYIDARK